MSLLAAVAVLGSGAPAGVRWPLATLALIAGGLRCRRESRRARTGFVLPGGHGTPRVQGRPVRDLRLARRGPLTVLSWRERHGRWCHRCFLPDTLSRQARRELSLAAEDWRVSRERRSMAP